MARLAPNAPAAPDADSILSPAGPYRALKQLGLVLLCGAWVVLGLVGHDPWKTEDATSFGIVYEMLKGSDLLTPNLAGEPFVDRPPLVYALAAVTGKLASGILTAHDAARLAAGLLLGLDVVPARAHRERALRPQLPLDAGAAVRRLRRLVGSRAPALARARVADRDRRRAIRLCARAAPAGRGRHRAGHRRRRSRSCRAASWARCGSFSLPLRSRSRSRPGARGATRSRRRSRSSSRCRSARHGRSRWRSTPRAISPRGGTRSRGPITSARCPQKRRRTRSSSSRICSGLRGPRCRSPRGRCGRAAVASTAVSPTPAVVLPGTLALVMLASIAVMADAEGDLSDADPAAACAARRARDRHAEAELLGRARLVRHPDVRPRRGARVVALVRLARARDGGAGRARPARHRSRIPAAAGSGSRSSVSALLTLLWLAARAPGAALESPRGAELGGRNDAAVGALLDDLAAVPRFAPQLPDGGAVDGVAPAGARMRREPQSRRAAARAVPLFRGPRHRARGNSADARTAPPSSSNSAASISRPRRRKAGASRGKASAAATIPSASCSTRGARR